MNFKYKIDEEVFIDINKKIYFEGTKNQQKNKGKVIARFYDSKREVNLYLVETEKGLVNYLEHRITNKPEQLLFYLLVKDKDVYEKLFVKPEIIPEGSKLLKVMGILDD